MSWSVQKYITVQKYISCSVANLSLADIRFFCNFLFSIPLSSLLFHHFLTITKLKHQYITFLTHIADTNHKLSAILHTNNHSILKSLIFSEFTSL